MGSAHVFGYGSLLLRGAGPGLGAGAGADAGLGEGAGRGAGLGAGAVAGVPCRLRGYRRKWNVAMDNTQDLPGYKFYVDRVTGERPAVMVTFLNIEEDVAGGQVNGVAFAVDGLAALDDRERNYRRVDVSGLISVEFDGPVWAYVGLASARRRYEVGAADGCAVIARAYHEDVVAGFVSLGRDALDEFSRTTDPRAVPLRDLARVAVPH